MTSYELIHTFYTAFANRDYKTMQQCYADDAVFQDEVFGPLNSEETKAMWEMLCKNAKNFSLQFSEVKADVNSGSAYWEANYVFSSTGKQVVNRIHATFTFENGKIKTHRDHFNFYKWASQALGLPEMLLGWTGFMRNKVQHTAMGNLKKFMARTA
ncbi:MAG: nuclear transport factor 2 family protein [Chitinophagales bacterium]